MNELIQNFLKEKKLAVVGVSRKEKFGNHIFKELKDKGYQLYPCNPHLENFMGEKCYASIKDLPEEVTSAIITINKNKSRNIAEDLHNSRVKNLWFQNGTVDKETVAELKNKGYNVISGKCIMMYAEPVGNVHAFHRFFSKLFGNY